MHNEFFDSVFQEEIYQIKSKPLVVIEQPWEKLGASEKELLSKIIGALKIPLDAINIVVRPALQPEEFNAQDVKMIYFGKNLGDYKTYEPHQVSGASFICSESLSQLLTNDAGKKQLWLAMKKLFLGQ